MIDKEFYSIVKYETARDRINELLVSALGAVRKARVLAGDHDLWVEFERLEHAIEDVLDLGQFDSGDH